jgi:ribosome recycling factor
MIPEIKKKTEERMQGVIDGLKHEFSTLRTGRASLHLLDDIKVDYYGTLTPISQVATLGIPDARTITIQPWESKIIPQIEKSVQKADLGLTPMNDGKIIRLFVPALTEERRKELVKKSKKMGEDTKVGIRNVRREANEALKKAEKDKDITEDELKKGEQDIQHMTDDFIKRIDDALHHKEQEIMEV